MSSPEQAREIIRLRDERQQVFDDRHDLLKRRRPRDARQAAAYDAQLRRYEQRLDALDKELNKLTKIRFNWRQGMTPHP